MVIVDNNILSSLAKANRLDLLEKLFEEVRTTPEVMHEFRDEAIIGYEFVENVERVKTYSNNDERWLRIVPPTKQENEQKEKLTEKKEGISNADAECLSVALNRDEALLTDDFRLGKVAKQNGIDVYDLETFLLACVKQKILYKPDEAKETIKKIEEKDFYTFSESFIESFFKKIDLD